ncbi:hypothetical protein V8V91_23855 [Algoriphagus halophilus]|uniref:hypothetical protein n=1 Tax=Algoriphagus halophilus TaxID=226505 RepID=UPI00358ED15E
MQKSGILFLLLFILSVSVFSQKRSLLQTTNSYFELVRPKFEGKEAYETVAFVEKYWRVAGNTGFNNTVYRISSKLEEAGYVLEEDATNEDRLTYRIETRKWKDPPGNPWMDLFKLLGKRRNCWTFPPIGI